MGLFKSKEEKAEIATARAVYSGIGTDAAAAEPAAVRALAAGLRSDESLKLLSERRSAERSGMAHLSDTRRLPSPTTS